MSTICRNDDPKNLIIEIENDVKCGEVEKNYSVCPPGYTKTGIRRVERNRVNCFLDSIVPDIPRYVGICQRQKGLNEFSSSPTDLLNCCIGIADPSLCKPGYCPGSINCDELMKNRCNDPNNVSSPECNSWCNKNSIQCSESRLQYCTNKNLLLTDECANYNNSSNNSNSWDSAILKQCVNNNTLDSEKCLNYATKSKNKQLWDNEWVKYCSKEENKPKNVCSCFGYKEDKFFGKPSCFNPICQTEGYHTIAMNNSDCPSICMSVISGSSSNITTIDRINIIQQCGEKYGTTPTTESKNETGNTSSGNKSESEKKKDEKSKTSETGNTTSGNKSETEKSEKSETGNTTSGNKSETEKSEKSETRNTTSGNKSETESANIKKSNGTKLEIDNNMYYIIILIVFLVICCVSITVISGLLLLIFNKR